MARQITKPGEKKEELKSQGDQDRADAIAAKKAEEDARAEKTIEAHIEAAKANGEEKEYRDAVKNRYGYTLDPEKKVAANHTVERVGKNVYGGMVIARHVETEE